MFLQAVVNWFREEMKGLRLFCLLVCGVGHSISFGCLADHTAVIIVLGANKEPKLGNNPRSRPARPHRHTDLTAPVMVLDENGLLDLLDRPAEPPLLLILDGIKDPHNLGACLRSADAAGVHAVVVPKDRSVALTRTVRMIACGAAEKVPFVQVTNLARCMKQLQDMGVWLVGTIANVSQTLYDLDLRGPLAFVMGSEGKGLRRLTAERCDFLVSIPMAGSVESLNVSVATGVCLFEAVRQRL